MTSQNKFAELPSFGSGMFSQKKHSEKNPTVWHWFLAGTLLNMCIAFLVVGLMVFYVQTELQSVRAQLASHENRLTSLETAPKINPIKAKREAATQQVDDLNGNVAQQLRKRRDQDFPERVDPQNNGTLPDQHEMDPGYPYYVSGRDGRDGREGAVGPKGDKGDTGIDGMQGPPGTHGLKGEPGDVITAARPSGGATYIRWGRTTCPSHDGVELVYAGIGAGSSYTHKGGMVDFLCLPGNPDWSEPYDDAANSRSYMYGMEYETSAFDPFSHENAEFIHDRAVPCAVCRLTGPRSSQLVVPAKEHCPVNWTVEYNGFLMSGNYAHEQRSQAVCVDQMPEAVPGSEGDQDGALLYIVEGVCGSLECPPYVSNREIICTVCSI